MTSPASAQPVWDCLDYPRLRGLLLDAVRVYSPSYAETPAAQVFAACLEGAGLAVERLPVPSSQGHGPRCNLLVRLGPQPPAMLWVGHIDTIEAVHGFSAPRVEGDVLRGLGAADMKSGCAAMVEAAIALHLSGLPLTRGLCLGLVVGEEEYGDGSLALINTVRAPLVIVGEPTDLLPCVSHNGYLECQLTAQGSRAHAAVPEYGANAIHAMLIWAGWWSPTRARSRAAARCSWCRQPARPWSTCTGVPRSIPRPWPRPWSGRAWPPRPTTPSAPCPRR